MTSNSIDLNKYMNKTVRNTQKLHLFRSCQLTMTQFCGHTTMHGYKYLIEKRRHPVEKFIWLIFLAVTVMWASYIAFTSWQSYKDKPTVTSLQTQRHPIWEVPFPSVCICSINRISKRSALQYANELVALNAKLNVSWTMRQIRYFGRMYDHNDDNIYEMADFQDILDETTSKDLESYDMQTQMKMLTPLCEDLLLKCQWEGKDVECESIFKTRLTMEGYCCAFNYVRPKNTLSFDVYREPMSTFHTGATYGLVVVVNTSTADYYYPIKNSIGFSISIHSPSEFPDETSGPLQRVVLNSRTEAYVMLGVNTVKADAGVASSPPVQRDCLFEYEIPDEYGGHYSFTDCIIKCKIRNYISLCGCIPFNLPSNYPDFPPEMRSFMRCNLSHIRCLHKYKNTINTIRPTRKIDWMDMEHHFFETVSCPDCLPLCSHSTYHIETTYSRIVTRSFRRKAWGILKNITHVDNVSVVRVFYPYVTSMMYTTSLVYTWQQIIAFYGGLLGICVGFSIVGFMEIVYYTTYRLLVNIFCPSKRFLSRFVGGIPSYRDIEQVLLANRTAAQRKVKYQKYTSICKRDGKY